MRKRSASSYPLRGFELYLQEKEYSPTTTLKYLQAVRSVLTEAETDPSIVVDSIKLRESLGSSSLSIAAWNNYVDYSRTTESKIPLAAIGKRSSTEARRIDVSAMYAHSLKLLLSELQSKLVPQLNIIQIVVSDYDRSNQTLSFPFSKISSIKLDNPELIEYIIGDREGDEPLVTVGNNQPASWDEWGKIVNQAEALPLPRAEYGRLYGKESYPVSEPIQPVVAAPKPSAPRPRPTMSSTVSL